MIFTNKELIERSKRNLSIKEFSKAGNPINLGKIDLTCPFEEQKILRMAIKVEGSEYFIPENLYWIKPMLDKVNDFQNKNFNSKHPFCYVTIRKGIVIEKTDDEWHVDGFSTFIKQIPEQNYTYSTLKGTEYAGLSINMPEDFDPLKYNVNKYLQKFVKDDAIIESEIGNIYLIDPYILHRRPSSTYGKERTFIRITFTPIEINDINNTQNPLMKRECTKDGVNLRNKLLEY